MSALLQNAAAIAACLAAALFVSWRAWQSIRGRSGGCGTGCGSCPSSAQESVSTAKALLSIEAPKGRSPSGK